MSTATIGASTAPGAEVEAGTGPRWGMLGAGVAWVVASLLILAFDERSVRVVGVGGDLAADIAELAGLGASVGVKPRPVELVQVSLTR